MDGPQAKRQLRGRCGSPEQMIEGVIGAGDFELNEVDIARIEEHFAASAEDRLLRQQMASD